MVYISTYKPTYLELLLLLRVVFLLLFALDGDLLFLIGDPERELTLEMFNLLIGLDN